MAGPKIAKGASINSKGGQSANGSLSTACHRPAKNTSPAPLQVKKVWPRAQQLSYQQTLITPASRQKKKSFPNIDAAALCDSSDRRRIQPVAWLTSKHFETEQTMGFYIPIRWVKPSTVFGCEHDQKKSHEQWSWLCPEQLLTNWTRSVCNTVVRKIPIQEIKTFYKHV